MASTPVTASSPDSPPSSSSPPSDSKSPPPPSPDQSSPPPPSPDQSKDDSSSSPPPPSKDDSSSSSPPPPSKDDSSSSPPPPSDKNKSPPPPPPPRGLTPSHHRNSPSDSNSNSSPNNDFVSQKLPLIVGLSVGGVILFVVVIAILAACFKKKKKRQHNDPMQYYMDPSHRTKGSSEYYNSSQHPPWQNSPQQMDHGMKGPPGSHGPPGGWHPPPPPPMMNSHDMSSNFSSGPRLPVLPPPSPSTALGFNQSTFTYDDLAQATNGFSQANLLGQGGFGYVHKGVLPNGKIVAVKSLKSGSGQGEREFQAEVEIISRVHHRHLVSLVGYCIAGAQRMLVYEFVPNNTLEFHLHGKGRPTMEWVNRLTIAMGSAKGLAYLHEDCHPRIIHRDIKAANILIDDNFEAMVADFGLAKLSSDNYTHVSTRVMGTFGYLAPEYASSGKLTEKSDVFSFGIMLLELITGRRPVDTTNSYMEDSLVDWARPILNQALADGNYDELVDPRLEGNYSPSEMARMVACASASIRHSARRRPKMSQIVRALEGDVNLEDLNDVVRPGKNSMTSPNGSSDYDTGTYNSDMKNIRKTSVTTSQEMKTSAEFGGHTSDHSGQHPSSSRSSEGPSSREMKRPGNHMAL